MEEKGQWQSHIHNPFSDNIQPFPCSIKNSSNEPPSSPSSSPSPPSSSSAPSNTSSNVSVQFSTPNNVNNRDLKDNATQRRGLTPSTPYKTPSSTTTVESGSKSRRRSLSQSTRNFFIPEGRGNWWTAFGVCLCHIICWLFGCCGQGRKCTRKQKAWWLVIVTFTITFLLTIFVSIEMYNAGAEPHILAWFSGGMCVFLAVPISVFEIFWHLVYFSNPSLQRYVIRILWMVPIYGIESWFALRYTENAVYLQAFREFYEAYVIWSFLHFLMAFLGDQEADIVNLLQKKSFTFPHIEHIPPFCCLKKWKIGSEFFYRCKIGVLQYVIIKIITTTITVICVNNNVYGEGEFNLLRGYTYIAFIDNFSQLWALYCLAMFYSGLKEELKPIKPFSKFLSVKAIVFFSWWQGFFIQIAVSTGYITHTAFYTKDNVARALQNWLVCIEMLIFAICHKYAFSYKEFVDVRDVSARNVLSALFDSTVPVDFFLDMRTFTHTFESLPSTDVVDGSQNSDDSDEYNYDEDDYDEDGSNTNTSMEDDQLMRFEQHLQRAGMGIGNPSVTENNRDNSYSNINGKSKGGQKGMQVEDKEGKEWGAAAAAAAATGTGTSTTNEEEFILDSISNTFEFRRNSAFDLEFQSDHENAL